MNKMEKIYNKLIRDNIPEIIVSKGQTPVVRVLDDNEYHNILCKKLQEEVTEYLEDNCIDELSDILEVLFTIAKVKGYSDDEIALCREKKNKKNGLFQKKLFLEKVITE